MAAITSEASVTGIAPCLSNPFVPSQRGSRGEPGTAKTSRPCSPASRAVIREPDRRAASTMMTPIERPEINRLRRGKSWARGSHPSGISEMAAPSNHEGLDQFNVLGGIDTVMAAGKNGDRAGLQAGAVCCRVDAACETGNDGKSSRTEIPRHSIGEFHASGRCVAGADDCDLWPREDVGVPTDADQRRRVVDHLQAQGIGRLSQRNVFDVPCTCGL